MNPLPNIKYVHVQAKPNDIIIKCIVTRVNKDFGPLINDIWDSGKNLHQSLFEKIMLIYK